LLCGPYRLESGGEVLGELAGLLVGDAVAGEQIRQRAMVLKDLEQRLADRVPLLVLAILPIEGEGLVENKQREELTLFEPSTHAWRYGQ
jgi:hypothetical protein